MDRVAVLCALLLCVSVVLGQGSPLTVHFGASGQGQHVVGSVVVGKTIWFNLDANTAVHADGAWNSQSKRSLKLTSQKEDRGKDQYGKFSRTTLTWGLAPQKPAFSTEVRSYPAENVAIFTTRVVSKTGLSKTNLTGAGTLLNFPSIQIGSGKMPDLGFSYFHGLWPQPVVGKNLTSLKVRLPNRHEGPVLFTSMDRESVLFGPLDEHFNTVFDVGSSCGVRCGTGGVLAFGPSGSLLELPESYSYSVAAVFGNGPTDTIRRYGKMVLGDPASSTKDSAAIASAGRVPDVFLEKVSAWTDNGAYYFYAGQQVKTMPPADTTLPKWVSTLARSGVMTQGLQLDGWWMNQTTSLPNDALFPNWDGFRKALGDTKILLYKAFFTEHYDLFKTYKKTQSPKGVWYPTGEDAYGFYGELFDAFLKLGMSAFETDFMSDHLMPTPGLRDHVEGLPLYHEGLTKAAAERNLPVQFCMPTVCQVLAAANFPAVTNARVSTDYATERIPKEAGLDGWVENYVIGMPGLLLWSIGLAPSKDITSTSVHQPGGGMHRDYLNVELDYVLAVLSTGPVGLGDGIGYTNVSLARAGFRNDGTLLKPSKPLTAVDSSFVPSDRPHGYIGFLPLTADGDCTLNSACSPSLDQTHSSIPVFPEYAKEISQTTLVYHIMLSMHLATFSPPLSDFYPRESAVQFACYREWRWNKCQAGKPFSEDCLRIIERKAPDAIPDLSSGPKRSDASGADAYRLFHFFPALPVPGETEGSWILLGEQDKIVPVSPQRFEAIGVNTTALRGSCLNLQLLGSVQEKVYIGAITPQGNFVQESFILDNKSSKVALCV
jgi:hypothetical protein